MMGQRYRFVRSARIFAPLKWTKRQKNPDNRFKSPRDSNYAKTRIILKFGSFVIPKFNSTDSNYEKYTHFTCIFCHARLLSSAANDTHRKSLLLSEPHQPVGHRTHSPRRVGDGSGGNLGRRLAFGNQQKPGQWHDPLRLSC
jgi:hypothetical protein